MIDQRAVPSRKDKKQTRKYTELAKMEITQWRSKGPRPGLCSTIVVFQATQRLETKSGMDKDSMENRESIQWMERTTLFTW